MAEIEKSPVVCKKEECDFLQGNVIEFEVKKDDCEIRADVTVKQKNASEYTEGSKTVTENQLKQHL